MPYVDKKLPAINSFPKNLKISHNIFVLLLDIDTSAETKNHIRKILIKYINAKIQKSWDN